MNKTKTKQPKQPKNYKAMYDAERQAELREARHQQIKEQEGLKTFAQFSYELMDLGTKKLADFLSLHSKAVPDIIDFYTQFVHANPELKDRLKFVNHATSTVNFWYYCLLLLGEREHAFDTDEWDTAHEYINDRILQIANPEIYRHRRKQKAELTLANYRVGTGERAQTRAERAAEGTPDA